MSAGDGGVKREFKGVWIKRDIWLARDLSLVEKVMLVEIESLENEFRGCFASNAHFAEFFDLSKSRVSEIISGLAKKSIISVTQIRDGRQVVERQLRLLPREPRPTPSENTKNPLRKKRRTPSVNASNPIGKGVEPPSENGEGSNTSLSNTGSSTGEVIAGALTQTPPTGSLSLEHPVGDAETALQIACRMTWKSYAEAYFERWKVTPPINAAVRTQIKTFVSRVGQADAPAVAAAYVWLNRRFYVENMHPVGVMLKDYQQLYTQWMSGKSMTATQAQQIDKTQSNYDAAGDAVAILRARREERRTHEERRAHADE